MAFLSQAHLHAMGFRSLGQNVRISDKASIYDPEIISIGDHSRIDDFVSFQERSLLAGTYTLQFSAMLREVPRV